MQGNKKKAYIKALPFFHDLSLILIWGFLIFYLISFYEKYKIVSMNFAFHFYYVFIVFYYQF